VNLATLEPRFDPDVTEYTVALKPWDDSVDLTATAQVGVGIRIGSDEVNSGVARAIPLRIGANRIAVSASSEARYARTR
jgi:hypothetical protein